MTPNIGTVDRYARIVLGVGLIALVFVGPKSLWGLLGLIPLITGLARFCPAYSVAGIRTCGSERCR